jgi:hypothetical protein
MVADDVGLPEDADAALLAKGIRGRTSTASITL